MLASLRTNKVGISQIGLYTLADHIPLVGPPFRLEHQRIVLLDAHLCQPILNS